MRGTPPVPRRGEVGVQAGDPHALLYVRVDLAVEDRARRRRHLLVPFRLEVERMRQVGLSRGPPQAIVAETKLSCTQACVAEHLLVDLVVHQERELVAVLERDLLVGQRAPGVELIGDTEPRPAARR